MLLLFLFLTGANNFPPLPVAGQLAEGHLNIYWDNANIRGGNIFHIVGDKVVSGIVMFNTSSSAGGWKPTWIQEICEVVRGSAESIDSNYSDSIFFDPPTATTLSSKDSMSKEIFSGLYARPAGNKSPDDNPLVYVINP